MKPNTDSVDSRYDIVMHTWGCKVNTYDTGLLQARFAKSNLEAQAENASAKPRVHISSAKPRVHILNTCAVTEEASREAARQIRRIKSKEPLSKVVVTGCGAQVDGGIFDAMPGADLIVANSHKGEIEGLIDRLFNGTLNASGSGKVFRSNIFRKEELEEGGGLENDHTRAFLKIQDGCNSFCSYCVIPFARGKSRSIPADRLVSRVNELERLGAREVVITGVHIADYEEVSNGKIRHLDDLVELILEKTTIPRIRISSLEPVELSSRLIAMYEKNARLCRHFHLSIQSAQTGTLQRMRRRYTAEDVERIFNEIKTKLPDAFVGLDLIVGFPGETEAEFQETYARLYSTPWTRIHVFPYSERPGTKALKLEDSVPVAIRARRAALIRELSQARVSELAEHVIGREAKGLVLRKSSEKSAAKPGRDIQDFSEFQLLTRNYWPVRVRSAPLEPGAEINVKMLRFIKPTNGRMDGWFEGEVAF